MANQHPRFSTFLAPFHDPDQNPIPALERDLDLARCVILHFQGRMDR
ncbi:MAG: hypothetical protein OSB67_09570 [Alphaproteobacteria bacterium]|nr:hypothetical protein [Alphaproteobacteria bacterium]